MAGSDSSPLGGQEEAQGRSRDVGTRRQRERARYLKLHREKLEKLVQRGVNRVLLAHPPDPFEDLLVQLSDWIGPGIKFTGLRCWPAAGDQVAVQFLASARGAPVACPRIELSRQLLARGLATTAGNEMSMEEAEALPLPAVASRARAVLGKILDGVDILDFQLLQERLSSTFAPQGEEPLEALFVGHLLSASGKMTDSSAIEVFRAGLLRRPDGSMRPEKGVAAPALRCREDIESWQSQWPELLFPALQGDTARRRLCVGVKVWAATCPEAATLASKAGHAELVDPAAVALRAASLKEAQSDEVDHGLPETVEPDERCPVLNAVAIMTEICAAMAAKTSDHGHGHLGSHFEAGLAGFRQALHELLPSCDAADPAHPVAAEHATPTPVPGHKGASPAPPTGGSPVPAAPRRQLSLAEQLRKGCVYCALHVDADAAWQPEEGRYSFGEDNSKTQEELVDLYAELCKSEPLLRLLIAPLSPRDPFYRIGLISLRGKLPMEVDIVDEAPGSGGELEMDLMDEDTESEMTGGPPNGRLRRLELGPLGLAALSTELLQGDATGGSEEQHLATRALAMRKLRGSFGAHGVYDFGAAGPSALRSFSNVADFSMAVFEGARRFLLPKLTPEEHGLQEALTEMGLKLRGLITAAYRQKQPLDGREKTQNLTLLQFRVGLKKLGFQKAEDYAELLFALLDATKQGSISSRDMEVLAKIDSPASPETWDEFRVWLSRWDHHHKLKHPSVSPVPSSPPSKESAKVPERAASKLSQKSGGSAAPTPVPAAAVEHQPHVLPIPASPAASLWKRLADQSPEGRVSQDVFLTTLRRIRHPGAVSPVSGGAMEMFLGLDLEHAGAITQAEFSRFSIFSGCYQLQRASRVRDFLVEQFGSLKSAFKAMDVTRSGSISLEDFCQMMRETQHYESVEDVTVACHFMDRSSSGNLTSRDFELLGDFDFTAFWAEVKQLQQALLRKHGSMEAAYEVFKSQAPEGVVKLEDFVVSCGSLELQESVDPQLHFKFLDTSHVGELGLLDFLQLGQLDSWETLPAVTNLVATAIGSIKAFLQELAYQAPPGPEGEAAKWAALHQALREETHWDLDLCYL